MWGEVALARGQREAVEVDTGPVVVTRVKVEMEKGDLEVKLGEEGMERVGEEMWQAGEENGSVEVEMVGLAKAAGEKVLAEAVRAEGEREGIGQVIERVLLLEC